MSTPNTPSASSNPPADDNSRKMRLAQAIQQEVVKGGVVETQSDYNAVIRYGKPVNHTLHLILTLVTCSIWSIAWLIIWIIAVTQRQTVTLTVDEFGQVLRQQV